MAIGGDVAARDRHESLVRGSVPSRLKNGSCAVSRFLSDVGIRKVRAIRQEQDLLAREEEGLGAGYRTSILFPHSCRNASLASAASRRRRPVCVS